MSLPQRPPAPGVFGWMQRHPVVVDGLLAGILFVLTALGHLVGGQISGFVAASMQTIPLVVRRARPVLVFTIVSLGCLVELVTVSRYWPSQFGFLIALYSLAAYAGSARLRYAGLGVGLFGAVAANVRWPEDYSVAGLIGMSVFLGMIVVVVWVTGDLMRRRRAYVSGLAEQNTTLLREREQREQLAAQAERARIAREMHDIVAHNLSVIVVQADGAAYAARQPGSPDDVRAQTAVDTLDTIARTARAALAETRRLVGVLRDEERGADYMPTAGLAEIPGLVESVRSSGLSVDLDAPADLPALPRDGDLAAYRIVQEALTNVIKHAGPAAVARVTLQRTGSHLVVDISDNGRNITSRDAAPGSGLIGMRERVTAAGGRIATGQLPGGGYRVRALLPLDGGQP